MDRNRSTKTRRVLLATLTLGACHWPSVAGASASAIAGMITPFGEGEDTYVAVAVTSGPGEAVSSLRWYNNDGSTPLGEVMLVEEAGGAPSLTNPLYAQREVYGCSDAWTQLDLPVSVAAAEGPLYAVLRIPAIARSARGVGGGPGVGFAEVAESSRPVLVSADGTDWVTLSPTVELAVEAVLAVNGAAKVGATGSDGGSMAAPRYRTALTGAYPNPANPSVRVRFEVAQPGKVSVSVYNVRGQHVRTLVDQWVPAGEHQTSWLGLDDRSRRVSSGVYFVRFEAGEVSERTRITLVR